MPDLLQKIPFAEDLLAAVRDFDCGDEEWERPLAAWIQVGGEHSEWRGQETCSVSYSSKPSPRANLLSTRPVY